MSIPQIKTIIVKKKQILQSHKAVQKIYILRIQSGSFSYKSLIGLILSTKHLMFLKIFEKLTNSIQEKIKNKNQIKKETGLAYESWQIAI